MIDVDIIPGDRVGSVQIGMQRDEVHAVLGQPNSRFKKTPMSVSLTDIHEDVGIHVYYTETDAVEFVETSSHPNIRHLVSGLDGFATPADQLISALSRQGHRYRDDHGYSFTFSQHGITFWRSDPNETYFESIGVARPDYFGEGDA